MNFSFYVITDTHYFATKLGCHGQAYEERMRYEQKCFAENEAINKATFKWLETEANEADTVIFPGDLSFNGEKESHLEFIELLKSLKASGKRVLVITAGHDFNDDPPAYDETGVHPVEGTKREELFDLYRDFGFEEAIALHRESLSYVAQLCPGLRLLALNNDGEPEGEYKNTYTPSQIEWIKEQTAKARAEGQTMIAMSHYPLLPACPLFALLGDEVVMRNADKITDMLADEGVHLCFTGHMHNQSIKSKETKLGNRFFDVCTGSLIGCPASIRHVTIKDFHDVNVKTLPVPDFDWDMEGLTNEEYFRRQFDMMIETYVESMAGDPEKFLNKLGVKADKKLLPLVSKVGEKLNNATLGGAARLFTVKCPESIKNVLFKDFAVTLVRQVFEGDTPYNYGTPEYALIMAVLKRLSPVLKPLGKKIKVNGEPVNLISVIEKSIGHYGISDNNAQFRI